MQLLICSAFLINFVNGATAQYPATTVLDSTSHSTRHSTRHSTSHSTSPYPHFQLSVVKQKPKLILRPITKDTDNPVNQQNLK